MLQERERLIEIENASERDHRQKLSLSWNKKTLELSSLKLTELLNKLKKEEFEKRLEFEQKEKLLSDQLFSNIKFLQV